VARPVRALVTLKFWQSRPLNEGSKTRVAALEEMACARSGNDRYRGELRMRNALCAVVLVLGLAGPAMAGDRWHIAGQSGTLACKLRSDAEQILHPPPGGFRELLLGLLLSGKCVLLTGGTEVVLSSRARTGDTVLVRRADETTYLYVDRWSVQDQDGNPPE
jgi:hypothetical protein